MFIWMHFSVHLLSHSARTYLKNVPWLIKKMWHLYTLVSSTCIYTVGGVEAARRSDDIHYQLYLWHHGGCGKHTHTLSTHTHWAHCGVNNADTDECVLGNLSEAISLHWWIDVSAHCAALLAYFSETLIFKPNITREIHGTECSSL